MRDEDRIRNIASSYGAPIIRDLTPKYQGNNSIIAGIRNSAIKEKTIAAGKDWYQVDHAYFGRWDYFRATKNACVHNRIRKVPADRWEKFKIPLTPWREGRYILVCLQSFVTYKFFGEPDWADTIVERLKQYTDRPVVIRPKGFGGIERDVKNAHAVVAYSSSACLDGLISGIPAFSVCAASKPIEDPWEKMESPSRPDREPLFWSAAYGQFTQDEMRSGYARSIVESDNDIL